MTSPRPVLGITISVHDSSACLTDRGRVLVAVEEERLTRQKHTGEFPLRAIEHCLDSQGLTLGDVECVAYSQVPWRAWSAKAAYALRRLPGSWDFARREVYWYLLNYGKVRTWMERLNARRLGTRGRRPREVFVPHHMTHAASAYFASPFERAAVLSVDQRGEWASTFFAHAEGARIEPLGEVQYPHSLGLLYLLVTRYLGFNYHEEYEVMGLAAYGKPRYADAMERIARRTGPLRFRFDERYLSGHFRNLHSNALVELLGPAREREEPIDERHCDVAASLQAVTERIVFGLLNDLHRATGLDALCMAGGVALNSVMNGKIRDATPFRDLFIQPAADDAGGSLGAALYADHVLLGGAERTVMTHAYTGPGYTRDEIRKTLDDYGLRYEFHEDIEVHAAGLLAQGKVLGWFQGRMEFGPRALGNRSILADPTKAEMRDRVNLVVKERQSFRPFAPAVMEERAGDYFAGVTEAPFMLLVVPVRPEAASRIPAVVHADGSARVQTVSRATNPRFWGLLAEFERRTGVPILLNTSFNVRGEPIVCSPKDALRTFYTSGLDGLIIDNFALAK